MNDVELLFVVLTVVYLWECAFWLRRGTVAFLTRWGRHWRVAHPAGLLGNPSGGILWAHPLPPLGGIVAGNQSPLSFSPDGVFSYVASCVNPGWRPPQPAVWFAWDEIKSVAASGKKVRVNGRLLVRTGTAVHAQLLAEQLQKLQALPAEKRAAAIREIHRDALDTKVVASKVTQLREHSVWLRRLTNILFVYLFGIVPEWIWSRGFLAVWLPLLIGLLGLTITIAVLFHRAHKALYPAATDERFSQTLLIALSPATSVRAQDALSRPLLEAFHPLAIAHILLEGKAFTQLARSILVELRFPCLPVCPVTAPGPVAAEQFSRETLLKSVEEFLKRNGMVMAELLQPPQPADESCRSYCPRCGAQFTTDSGVCADCGGMPLQSMVQGAASGARPT